jgi:DNA-binding MarR family transcriptional regulator
MVQATRACPALGSATLVPDLYRIARRLRRLSGSPQLDVATLMLLHRLGCEGATRPSDLAGELGLDASTVSRHARTLLEAGLVERQPDPDDGRSFRLSLTPDGERAMAEAFQRREDAVAAATASWDPGDVADLRRLLGRLADDLEQTDPDPTPRVPQEIR